MRQLRRIGVWGLCAVLASCASGPSSSPDDQAIQDGELGVSPDLADYIKRAGPLIEKEPAGRGFPSSSGVWPMTEIAVGWEDPKPEHEKMRAWVRDAVERSWCAHSALRLTGWGKADASTNIRIQIDDVNPHTKGLGRHLDKMKNGMVLNFEFKKWAWAKNPGSPYPNMSPTEFAIRCIAIHEFGHALGIAHEHNRPDTPEEAKKCFAAQGTDGDLIVGSYDKDSCMNYANKKWSNYGVLSEGDKNTIVFLYPKTPKPPAIGKAWKGFARAPETRLRPGFGVEFNLTQSKTEIKGTATVTYIASKATAEASEPLHASRATFPVLGWQVNNLAILYPAPGARSFELEKIVLGAAPEMHKVAFDGAGKWSFDGQPVEAAKVDALIGEKGLRVYMPNSMLVRLDVAGERLLVQVGERDKSYTLGLVAIAPK